MAATRNIETEPPMHIQRPSSGRSQDVSHILSGVFRELFTREVVGPKTVKNLATSKTGDNSYHDKYVEKLRKIQEEREQQIQETMMLETHIMQAQAAAMVADERELMQAAGECRNYHELGLPPVKSHLKYCLDNHLLRSYHLITPQDFIPESRPPPKPPQADSKDPLYRRETTSSQQHFRKEPPEDEYHDTPLPIYTPPPTGKSYIPPTAHTTTTGKTKSLKSSKWQDSMKPDQRQVERTDLKRMQDKLDYLRNPRCVPPGAAQEKIPIATKSNIRLDNKPELTDLFIPSPNPVVFTDYQPGKVYELTLDLKNVTSASRQVRALPPASKYFSVGLGQFPGERGIVAPGMSCQFPIKFAPDSLADYDDVVKIKTQLDQPILIQLQGRRPPPVLSLPSELDCGHQLVGGKKIVKLSCHNSGGDGQFCILRKCDWPSKSFQWSLNDPGHVSIEPFHIEPAMFELLAGQTTTLQITFTPGVAKFFKEQIVMACDNCHILDFSVEGVGQLAGVEFVSVDGGLSEPELGESLDSSAQYLVRFADQNPQTTKQKTLTVKNTTNVNLPFRWKILQPDPCNPGSSENDSVYHSSRAVDHSNSFTINPRMGVLTPNDTAHFTVEFNPTETGSHHSVGHLILEEVPLIDNNDTRQPDDQDVLFKDIVSLEVELKALCKPCEVLVTPSLMMIPGELMIGTEYIYHFKMFNNSVSRVVFDWQNIADTHQLSVVPTQGSLEPAEEKDFDLVIVGRCPGQLKETINCSIDHVASPVYLHVTALIQGPKVEIDLVDLDLGLVRLGESVTKSVPVRNLSKVSAKWSIMESHPFILKHCKDSRDEEQEAEFTFIPSYGILPPEETCTISVSFTPVACRRVRTVFECRTETGHQSCLTVRGEVQSPQVCLLACNLVLDEVYVNVPITRKITLQNMTLLPAEFSWEQGVGSDSSYCRTFFHPAYGVLGPRETLSIQVTLTSAKEGALDDVFYPCFVRGMEKPIWMGVKTFVRGLSVSFKTPNADIDETELELVSDAPDDLSLEFGNVPLGANLKTILVLTNTSAIRTSFSLEVEYFKAKPPTPPQGAPQGKGPRRSGQSLLGRTPNISDPFSKTASKAQSDHCSAILRDGRGAAFVPYPASGELTPFGRTIIELTSFSDMWGDYNDNLICKVEGLEQVLIPIHMNVHGCPLNYQMVKNQKPILRFGTHVSGAPPVIRSMRVNNSSPYDIRVDWQTFNVFKDDFRVIDMLYFVGEAFPHQEDKPTQAHEEEREEDTAVKVQLRVHEGSRGDKPFSVHNPQQIIPAKGYANMVVQFTPESSEPSGVQCEAFISGYMSLDKEVINVEGKVQREHGLNTEPFRLDITAGVKPALLSIEMEDDDGCTFVCPASNLLQKVSGPECAYEVGSSFVCNHHMTLTNNSESPLTFLIKVPAPFTILSMDHPHSSKKDRTPVDGSMTLKIGRNLGVEVGVRLTMGLIKKTLNEGNSDSIITEGSSRTLHYHEDFHVNFKNGSSQVLPLRAIVALPSLQLSRSVIDFGVCLVGQSKELQVELVNPSGSASFWRVCADTRYPEVSRDKFVISPTSGFLDANLSNISENKKIISVVFTAKHNVEYESVFIFTGILEEEAQYLTVKGRGTYDQKHEELVNILYQ